MQGLYLAPPHGELIATGRKVAIAKARPMGLEGEWILLSGGHAYGLMRVGTPEQVDLPTFQDRKGEHGVSEKERKRWWPEQSPLYLYPVEGFVPYVGGPVEVDLPSGVQTRVDIKGLGLPVVGVKERIRVSLKRAKWRTLKDGRHVAISGTEKRGVMSSRGEATVRNIERDLIRDKEETAVVLMPNGEVVFEQWGDTDSVTFTEQQMAKMGDAVLTHNHPVTGGSFSSEDVWMAVRQDAAEVRAVGIRPGTKERYLYRLTRPPDGWSRRHPLVATRDGFNIVSNAHNRKVREEFMAAISARRMTIPEAEFEHQHAVWSRMAESNGWEYSRERL